MDAEADNLQLCFWCLRYGKVISEVHCPSLKEMRLWSRHTVNPLIDRCAQTGKEIQNKEKINLPSCIGQRTLDPHHFVRDQKNY